jgi:hypothetical protein
MATLAGLLKLDVRRAFARSFVLAALSGLVFAVGCWSSPPSDGQDNSTEPVGIVQAAATPTVNVAYGTNPRNSVIQVAPKGAVALTAPASVTWALTNNNSSASLSTMSATTTTYTAGATANVSDLVTFTAGASTGTQVIEVGPGVTIYPPQPNVKASSKIALTASGGSGTGWTWSMQTSGSGSPNVASSGVYTSGAATGTDVVKVVDGNGNSATATIHVLCGADSSLQILYPYSGTVFPLGLLPPLIQWQDNNTASYAKITLQYPTTGTAQFLWSEIVKENGPLSSPYNLVGDGGVPTTGLQLGIDGGVISVGGGRAQIPSLVWTTFQNAAAGNDALISVQTLESNQGTYPETITVHFATASLSGNIYYSSYDTNLVTHGASSPVGAVLGIAVGASSPTLVDPTSTAGTTCRACHTMASQGTTLFVNDCLGGAPCTSTGGSGYIGNLYGGEDMMTLPGGTESIVGGSSKLGVTPNDGHLTWGGLSPDGTMVLTSEGTSPTWMSGQWYANNVSQQPTGLYKVSTDTALSTSGLPTGLQTKFPAWATDTSAVAFNYAAGSTVSPVASGTGIGDDQSLAMMSFTGTVSSGSRTFSSLNILFNPPTPASGYPVNSGAAEWPSFMPAGQNGIVFENRVAYNCDEPGADGAACSTNQSNGNGELQHNIGALGELWWVNTSGNYLPHRLSNANGVGNAPLGANAHGLAGTTVPSLSNNPSDSAGGVPTLTQMQSISGCNATPCSTCPAALLSIFGNGNDTVENFKPTVNPQTTGGYQWLVFMSRRMYGNVVKINPYASNPRTTLEMQNSATPQYPQPKKLWVAAMKTTPTAGTDPSYPAFYLEGQELYAGNSRGYWVLPQCTASSTTLSSANLCNYTSDCCQTTASSCTLDTPITTTPPTKHCIPTSSIACKSDGASCDIDSDCCTYASEGTRCSGSVCTVPPQPGYPTSESITYDFQASCSSSGTSPVWEYIQTDQTVPTGTSIAISAQTATSQAGLASATPTSAYSVTTTVSAPSYLSGPFNSMGSAITVDQALRALTPPQASAGSCAGDGGACSSWLRVNVTLNSSTSKQSTPTLVSLVPTFDCAPTE